MPLYALLDIVFCSWSCALVRVHLGAAIGGANVVRAFEIQHPSRGEPFLIPPLAECSNVGDVSEALCSEVLSNAGLPAMELDSDRWPIWVVPGHILLNHGKMSAVQAFGDILIPAAPTNLVVSVKSEKARERLLYSSNAIEGVGFGFFNSPKEFWTPSRMKLYKRMGFTAIYLPPATLAAIDEKLRARSHTSYAVNINGTPLLPAD